MASEEQSTGDEVTADGVSAALRVQLQRTQRLLRALSGAAVLLVFALMVAWPRSAAYTELVDENLSLRIKLQEIDRRMAEIDQILLRLRLYDAQMESLANPRGEHGPIPEDAFANQQLAEDDLELADEAETDIRPAATWADAVIARADAFLGAFAAAEPDLNRVMAELEELRALSRALPSAWPAEGKLTSGFGWRRNPFGRTWKFHSGLDIAAKRGTAIFAPARGTVIGVSYNSGYGRMLEIDHGFGITTVYAHCNSIRVKKGATVKQGDFVATIGNTGRTTGPHLHFEVRLDSHPVDPMDYLSR
jgi:murein DD-endopeptidase MepM/ murein hydrolase activator NlpD